MAVKSARLGPGTLTLGATASSTDFSCQLLGGTVTTEVSTDDPLRTVCGDEVPGQSTSASKLEGSLILDPYTGGSGEYTWTNHLQQVEFDFTPNTAAGLAVAGILTVTRLDIGTDEYGKVLQSDFSWDIVGEPTPTWGTATP